MPCLGAAIERVQEKKANRDLQRKVKVEEELSELASNQAEMAVQAEQMKNARGELKQFWQNQVAATAEQRQKEKDCSDVYKKQI